MLMGSEGMFSDRFILSALLYSIAILIAFGAFAAEDGTLSLSPAVVMLSGSYGQSTTQTLTLLNGTSRPFSFDLVAFGS